NSGDSGVLTSRLKLLRSQALLNRNGNNRRFAASAVVVNPHAQTVVTYEFANTAIRLKVDIWTHYKFEVRRTNSAKVINRDVLNRMRGGVCNLGHVRTF